MQLNVFLAAADGGVIEGLKNTAQEVGLKFGFNTQLFLSQLIAFFIFAALLYRFAFRPLLAILSERERKIAESLAAAEKAKADLAKADEDRRRVLAEAGQQANKIIEEARAAAARLSEQEAQKAVSAANDIIAKARLANESELVRMRGDLRKEFGRLVATAAGKASGKVLNADDQRRLADEANHQLAA